MTPHRDSWPAVTVVMAVRNEQHDVAAAVESVFVNGYEGPLTMVIALGPSHDDTAQVVADLALRYAVEVVDNAHGGTPQGLNTALERATTDIVIRMDGHAVLPEGYIATAVAALERTGAANVGGRMVPTGTRPLQHAIALAMGSRWGIGGAGHRIGGAEGPTDSVYLGAFRRATVDEVGGYDPHFARAQDWELNARLRAAGHVIWFVPELAVTYRPRSSWGALARQFHQSGRWRREVARRYRGSTSLRYVAPPLTLGAVVLGTAIGIVGALSGPAWLMAAWAAPGAYLVGVVGATASLVTTLGWRSSVLMPGVLITMHMAWATGFLRGLR